MEPQLDKVIVALDNMSGPMAEEIMDNYVGQVYGFKVNHVLYDSIDKSKKGRRIFCDYKLFDIPNTMCNVIEKLIDDGVDMVTVSMLNNRDAIRAVSKYADRIKLLGVTYLTSWSMQDSLDVTNLMVNSMYDRSIHLMEENGFWGGICSPKDLIYFSGYSNKRLNAICPGIRLEGEDKGDQKRTSTPEYALDNGADYLVMGRSFQQYINRGT